MKLAVRQLAPDEIAAATLYTSCEPGAMGSGARYWGGINRMAYAMEIRICWAKQRASGAAP